MTGGSTHCDNHGNCFSSESTHARNVSLELTREIMKRCPNVLTVTDNRDAADFDLRISPGSSTLYRQNGDVAYVSPTKYHVSNLAKDVCNFVGEQHQRELVFNSMFLMRGGKDAEKGDLITYTADCAKHDAPDGKPCQSIRFKFDVERPGAEDEYVCIVCGAKVIGDEKCLAINRLKKR